MDVVILAGGRGGRLTGIAAPYHKPLLPINGVPNVVNCVNVLNRIRNHDGVDSITVVVAPENALVISQVLPHCDDDITVVVQREPRGPGYALLEGLKCGEDANVMVLLADNILTHDDIEKIVAFEYAVAVTTLPASAALQYTWWDSTHGIWREKEPALLNVGNTTIEAWCGPITINRDLTLEAYGRIIASRWDNGTELAVGPYLAQFVPGGNANRVPLNCTDIGHLSYWRE